MPKVSVVIPCYNQAQYLPDAVKSVVEQTYGDIEILIVNDGSPDDTKEVAKGLVLKYPDYIIRVINQENQGLPIARNNGIEESKGAYIMPLDSDDMIKETYVEEAVRVLDENPDIGFAYGEQRLFGDVPQGLEDHRYGSEYELAKLIRANIVPVCGLFRKNAWRAVGGYKKMHPRGLEDWEFWITLGEAGYPGKFINKPLFLYRKHGYTMLSEAVRNYSEIKYQLRHIHPRLYYPRLGRISVWFARAYNHAMWHLFVALKAVFGPLSHYLYRNHPAVHALLKPLKSGPIAFIRSTRFAVSHYLYRRYPRIHLLLKNLRDKMLPKSIAARR